MENAVTPTPQQLRALTHPARLRMLGVLRAEGPATATTLARLLGINTGATSYHLRQLAQHGFIVEDEERGNGRDRWWRAAHAYTQTQWEEHPDPANQETLDAYLQAVVVGYSRQLQEMIEERAGLSHEWRNASSVSDYRCRLNPEKARRLLEQVTELIEAFQQAEELPEDDTSAVPYTIMFHGFPSPGGRSPGTS